MIRIVTPLAALTAALALGQPANAAGTLTRAFVSSAGVDSNPCTTAAPCATFAAAYAAVISGGIVTALDPGKYGALTITGPVTINGNGWSAITAPASGAGITVNAGSGAVTLIGLEIDGTGGTGNNGIVVNSAGSLIVSNCMLQNFAGLNEMIGTGILLQPASGTLDFAITNTTVTNNRTAGIAYFPPSEASANANGVIDHVIANANEQGIAISSGLASSGTTIIAISNSVASDNSGDGIVISNGFPSITIKVSIDNVTASGNGIGIVADGFSSVLLGRSVVTGNTTGIQNTTQPSSTLYTYKDNRIDLNGSDFSMTSSAMNMTFSQQ